MSKRKAFVPKFDWQPVTIDHISGNVKFPESLNNGIERGMSADEAFAKLESLGFKRVKVESFGMDTKYQYVRDSKS